MLNAEVAKEVIDYGLIKGADFVELFVDKQSFEAFSIKSSKVENVSSGIDFGIGVRLIYGTNVLYGYTNSTSKDDLLNIISSLATGNHTRKFEFGGFNFQNQVNRHPITHSLYNNIDLDQRIPKILDLDKKAREQSSLITQFMGGVTQNSQQIEIFNSEGLHTSDERNYIRLRASAVASDGTLQDTGSYAPGAMMGWDFIEGLDNDQIAQEIVKEATTKLKAKPCPAGKMPVVIDNGFGGVIFHEACGHLLETTSVAKKASVFHDKMGEMIASSVVSAVDDGTNENYWGSINIDDEGMATQKTQLIKDGKLTSFMVDKLGSMKTGYERTGCGRRESYKFAPTSRMRNTYIEEGTSKLEEMISSIDKGIYCKKMGGGSVSPGTGEFNFAAIESYLIEDGKISHPVKGATLIGSGPEALKQISMVGDNLDLAAGVCGSVSGGVRTTVGQPAIKVDEILVGGGQ